MCLFVDGVCVNMRWSENVMIFFLVCSERIADCWLRLRLQNWLSLNFRLCIECWVCNLTLFFHFYIISILSYFFHFRLINFIKFNEYSNGFVLFSDLNFLFLDFCSVEWRRERACIRKQSNQICLSKNQHLLSFFSVLFSLLHRRRRLLLLVIIIIWFQK